MTWIKRALISLIRRPGKNAILLLVVFLLGNVMAGAVSVRKTIQSTQKSLYQSIPAVATIFIDFEKLTEWSDETGEVFPPNLSTEAVHRLGKLPYVAFYDYSLSAFLYCKGLSVTVDPAASSMGGTGGAGEYAFATLQGTSNPEPLDMREGSIRLVEGRTFTQEEIESQSFVTLISTDVAEKNQLTVGSTVTLENLVFWPSYEVKLTDEEYTSDENIAARQRMDFTVIGLFEVVKQPPPPDSFDAVVEDSLYYRRLTRFYTGNRVVEAANWFTNRETEKAIPEYVASKELFFENTFVLENASYLDEFRAEVAPMIADVPLQVNDTGALLEEIIAPMRTFDWIASLVLYIAMAATVLTLSLLILLFLRDRKEEIGIYRSLGEKKEKVVGQILLEVAAVALIGITLSLFTGNLLSGTLSERLLTDQVVEYERQQPQQEIMDGLRTRGYNIPITLDSLVERYAETYQSSLDTTTLLLFYAVGMGTTTLSTLLPVLYILMLKPRKMLL